jgi:hypothetical protein
MTTILLCFLMAVLMNLPMFLHSYHRRRYSEAKLEIARVVTEMETLMLHSELKIGDICHDHIYQNMVRAHYAFKYSVPWTFWRRPADYKIVRQKVHDELSRNTRLATLLARYTNADFKAFRSNRPAASFGFMLWVLIFAGGLGVLVIGLISIFTAKKAWGNYKKVWGNYKQLASELYVACNSAPA